MDKKGKASWRPAKPLEVTVGQGFRARWRSKEDTRYLKARAEGWVTPEEAGVEVMIDPITAGGIQKMKGAHEYRELVLMVLPEDLAKAREEYIENRTQEQSVTPAERTRKSLPESKDFIFDDGDSLMRY